VKKYKLHNSRKFSYGATTIVSNEGGIFPSKHKLSWSVLISKFWFDLFDVLIALNN